MKQKERLGLYVHIPFCKSKCLYCDFCSFPHPKEETVERYVEALGQDLLSSADRAKDFTVDTVYFGGGTPTVLSAERLCRLLSLIDENYHLKQDAEITLECNPRTGDAAFFSSLRRDGFNRVSVGLQSSHEQELRALGRQHTFENFCKTYTELRAAGFCNVSVDVMSGIPHQSTESYLETLQRITALAPEHISAYGLIVEEGTAFATLEGRGKLPLPDEETARQMYFEGIRSLASAGYAQYEISNFSKIGYESRHNMKYWNCEPYLGFGPSAYSDFLGKRFGNSRDLVAYNSGEPILAESETPSSTERQNEYVMLRMRLCEGISARAFEERFETNFEASFGHKLRAYVSGGFVRETEDGYAFTEEGMYVSNAILSDVLEF